MIEANIRARVRAAIITPEDWAGLLSRITTLESQMGTIAEALANAQTQIAELNAAAAQIGPFIDSIKAQVADLQAMLASIGNPAEIAAAVQAIADSVDTVEQGILAAVTPPPAPTPPPAI